MTTSFSSDEHRTPVRPLSARSNLVGAAWGLFGFEFRRGLPTVLVFAGFMVLVELWRIWRAVGEPQFADGDARAAVALPLLVPLTALLGVSLAFSGWSRARTGDSLAWAATRPLPAVVLLAVRIGVIAVSIAGLWGFSLLLFRVSPGHLLRVGETLGGSLVVPAAALGIVCLALFLSTLAISEWARLAVVLVSVATAAWVVDLLSGLGPVPASFLAHPETLEKIVALWLGVAVPVALLFGAWVAVRRAVLDARRARLALLTVAAVGLAGAVSMIGAARTALDAHPSEEIAMLPLLDGAWMRVFRDPDVARPLLGVELETADGEIEPIAVSRVTPFVHRQTGRSVIVDPDDTVLLVDETGSIRRRRPLRRLALEYATGWSPDGSLFATPTFGSERWIWGPEAAVPRKGGRIDAPPLEAGCDESLPGIVLIGWDGDRCFPVPETATGGFGKHEAVWLDRHHLLVQHAASTTEGLLSTWAIFDVREPIRAVAGPFHLPRGTSLEIPWSRPDARIGWRNTREIDQFTADDFFGAAVPRRGADLALWRIRDEERDLVVVRAPSEEEARWRLETLVTLPIPRQVLPPEDSLGLGSLAEGTLVWVDPDRGGQTRWVWSLAPTPGSRPSRACRVPADFRLATFQSGSGGVAVWSMTVGGTPVGTAGPLVCDLESAT